MSVFLHTAIIAAVLIIPLVATDVLPTPPTMTVFMTAPVPPPPPPPTASQPPLPIGGDIKPPTRIKAVKPLYPTIAPRCSMVYLWRSS